MIIKTLVNSDSTYIGPEGREVFKREAAFFNDLRHPQIVRFLAIMADSFSVVLEFMNEGSLDTFIKEKGPLGKVLFRKFPKFIYVYTYTFLGVSWPDRFNVMCDVSSAMKFLHDRNRNNGTSQTEPIIHQNIRSSNVLIERNDKNELRAKVTGFGFSSVKDMIEDKTALFGQKGKQRDVYSPPELHQSRKITWVNIGGKRTMKMTL